MKTVQVYTKKGCGLCDIAVAELEEVRATHPFDLRLCYLEDHPEENAKYGNDIPVILVENKEVCRHRLDRKALVGVLRGG